MNEKNENIGCGNITLPSMICSGKLKHHHETLIGMANDALGRKEYELSVILTTAASEILTERAFRLLFSFKDIEYLYDAVIQRHWYNNITNKNSRKLYSALSKDDISKSFKGWSEFKKHYKRRHEIVHRGEIIGKEDARKSYKVVTEYIKHIESIIETIKPDDWKL